ncbi:MAG: adenylate cyclase, partial [Crocinitomicaceae bacterium]
MSSNAENEHFCDGITEEIINALAKINELKVTSRTSSFHFKNKELPIVEISKSLNVAIILEGSVRLSGEMIRITAQLIQAEDDFHFWSETWDRKLENIFEIQDEISLLIADKIRENFGHFELQDHLVKKQTEDINAYEYSLLASFHKNKWNVDDVKLAEELYLKAIETDANHVESIVGLSDAYSFMAMTGAMSFEEAWVKSSELVNRAMEIDPKNPEIYYQKANSAFFTECDFDASLKYAHQAIQLKPNYVEAQQFLSFLYVVSDKNDAAKKHLDIALGIDPLSQETLFFKAYFDYMTENYAPSLIQLNECLAVNPKNIPAHAVKCLCLLKMGRFDDVIHYYDDPTIQMVEGDKIGVIGLGYVLKGDAENAEKYMTMLQEQAKSPDGFTQDSFVFMMHVAMGNTELAFDWISTGIKTKASLLLLRYADPIIGSLKSDPRYDTFYRILFPVNEAIQKPKKKELLDSESAEQFK